jgi:Negative regulator of sigma F
LLILTSVPLAIALAAMLRYAALLRGGAVAMTGGLAVAAITATALSLFHDHDATVLILVWNLGTTALITGLGILFGRGTLRWMTSRLLPSLSST